MLPLNKVDSRTALHHRGGQRYLDRVASSRREAMAKYFVTGATGFIRARLPQRLAAPGQRGAADVVRGAAHRWGSTTEESGWPATMLRDPGAVRASPWSLSSRESTMVRETRARSGA